MSKPYPNSELPRVGMYTARGTNPDRLAASLRTRGFGVESIVGAGLARLSLNQTDVLYLPGGWYDFDEAHRLAIRQFVESGGGCVGTCAGAYRVIDSLKLIVGRALRANIRGRVYLEPQRGDHPILRGIVRRCMRHDKRTWEPIAVTHLGGPMVVDASRADVIASYDVEGEVAALLATAVGRGRAVAIASHPELELAALPADDTVSDKAPEFQGDASTMICNAVLWAARRDMLIEEAGDEHE